MEAAAAAAAAVAASVLSLEDSVVVASPFEVSSDFVSSDFASSFFDSSDSLDSTLDEVEEEAVAATVGVIPETDCLKFKILEHKT
ncbi:unnamed protein product [[Candida] boidinii]|nr:unnamed protein product [[Candida] boidinii]